MDNTFLPYGSIVRLKEGTSKLVIIGIHQQSSNNQTYDYSAVEYPYGYLKDDELILFNSDNIDEVISKGYSDEELENYYDDLIWALNRNNKGEQEDGK